MTQGSQSLHLSGSKVSTNSALDVNASNALQHMKQELNRLQADNKKLTDQLNCFISLVQRSWKGDRHATIHLSNIIGLDPPQTGPIINDGSQARPNSQINQKTRCEQNWERLAMKLLEREYQAVQQEIREYQQRYIQNRQAYMDAVLQDHQQTMSAIPLSRQPSSHTLENCDSRFINHHKVMQRIGGPHPHDQVRTRRVQSAKVRPRTAAKDQVKALDFSLKDLVGDVPSSGHFVDSEALGQHHTLSAFQNGRRRPQTSHPRHPPNTYNDPGRYIKGDLYDVRDGDVVKRQRPVSASSLREGDSLRARPRSGSIGRRDKGAPQAQTFLTQKNERSLKYEATKPVYVHPKQQSNPRRNSDSQVSRLGRAHSQPGLMSQTQFGAANTSVAPSQAVTDLGHENDGADTGAAWDGHSYDYDNDFADNGFEPVVNAKPPMSVRVKSAHTRRPAYIDKFTDEERTMREMEADFKKTALTLQKKLGLQETGIIALR